MILDDIVARRRQRVAAKKQDVPQAEMERRAVAAPPPRDFRAALDWRLGAATAAEGPKRFVGPNGLDGTEGLAESRLRRVAVMAELKPASPVKGRMRAEFDAIAIAQSYAEAGVDALSVLTEPDFFLGDATTLVRLRREFSLPLLCKDFIIDPYQVYEARALGADAVLLIVSVLDDENLGKLLRLTHQLGMAALVEVDDEVTLRRAVDAGAKIIGINNRDLRTFQTDLLNTGRLAPLVPAGATVVSESGVKSAADMRYLFDLGVQAALVGEALVRAPDVTAKARELLEGGTGSG